MDNKIILSYEIDGGNFSGAGEASSSVKKVLKQLGVDSDIIRRVVISMYEAEINAVIHAGGGRAEVEISPDKIYVKFTDDGPGIADVQQAMREGFSTASQKIREMGFGAGMGLPNIKSYTDEIRITSDVGKGTVVEMVVYLQEPVQK
ncbi:MAG: anti-sigma regulatory factor [Clostridiales bacterium]|jgi:anti-sigma regulatory factor (Ser/Thr protein kinase)|nr:anti-sigma regulatory factor [Clostridiales bacterium]